MTFIEKVAAKIESEEGRRHSVYLCTSGKRTIGVGFNLDDHPVPGEVVDFWRADNDYRLFKLVNNIVFDNRFISDRVIDFWLNFIIIKLVNKLVQHEWFNKLDENRRVVLVDMSFQLGLNGMLRFVKMINALRAEHWHEAASQLLDSLYASEDQTPERAQRNAEILRSGEL